MRCCMAMRERASGRVSMKHAFMQMSKRGLRAWSGTRDACMCSIIGFLQRSHAAMECIECIRGLHDMWIDLCISEFLQDKGSCRDVSGVQQCEVPVSSKQ